METRLAAERSAGFVDCSGFIDVPPTLSDSAPDDAVPGLFARDPVIVAPESMVAMAEVIRAIETVAALPAWRAEVLDGAPAIARLDPGPRSVFMGYDFHLTAAGPRLIEVNTNAGGALLNACRLRASDPERASLLGAVFFRMFREEWRLQRDDRPLGRVVLVDDAPDRQFLYPEFRLFVAFCAHYGVSAGIADARDLAYSRGRLWHDGVAVDLVYNRLTDFYLEEPAHAALRAASIDGAVVMTPTPRAHALLADKRNLIRLTDAAALRRWAVDEATIAILTHGIPATVSVRPEDADALWARRRGLFFKPVAGFGGKAVYRGDKLTKRVWSEILAGGYVAQELAPPSEQIVTVGPDRRAMKVDIRHYTYNGRIQLTAARLYQGQTTNFRTPGGGFAPVQL